MSIETTMYVRKKILEKIDNSVEITGKSRTYIISLLMQRVMNENHKKLKFFSRIKYQKRDLRDNWHRLHIILNEYEYEYYLDMRKFYKMSVSLILAFAVRKYLKEVIDTLLNKAINTDNYRYKNYLLTQETIEYGLICWKIYWGIPKELNSIQIA